MDVDGEAGGQFVASAGGRLVRGFCLAGRGGALEADFVHGVLVQAAGCGPPERRTMTAPGDAVPATCRCRARASVHVPASALCLEGALVLHVGGVPVDHRAVVPLHKPHQVAFVPAAR